MKSFLRFIKTTIIGGVIFLIPVIILITVIGKAIQISLKLSEPISKFIPIENIYGLAITNLISVLLIAVICFLAGMMAHYTIFNKSIEKAESNFLLKIPGYAFIKGFTDSIRGNYSTSTMKPVIINLDDSSQVAFEIEKIDNGKSVIYMPGAPNPWSGSILIVTQNRVEYLPVTMASTIKIFSMLGKGTGSLMEIKTNGSGISKDE